MPLILTKIAFSEGETGKISAYSSIDCTDEGLQYMLCLRKNQVHYIHLLDNLHLVLFLQKHGTMISAWSSTVVQINLLFT